MACKTQQLLACWRYLHADENVGGTAPSEVSEEDDASDVDEEGDLLEPPKACNRSRMAEQVRVAGLRRRRPLFTPCTNGSGIWTMPASSASGAQTYPPALEFSP